MKYDYKHSLFVNKKNKRVVSADVIKIGNKIFIQYRNPYGDSRRRTTLTEYKFLQNYREINEKTQLETQVKDRGIPRAYTGEKDFDYGFQDFQMDNKKPLHKMIRRDK